MNFGTSVYSRIVNIYAQEDFMSSNTNETEVAVAETTAQDESLDQALQEMVEASEAETVDPSNDEEVEHLSVEGEPLFVREDWGLEANGAATYAVDVMSDPAGIYKYDMATNTYVLDPSLSMDANGELATGPAQDSGTDSSPSSVLNLGDESQQGPSSSGVNKTGGATVDLTNDDFYFLNQDKVREDELDAGGSEPPYCKLHEKQCIHADGCVFLQLHELINRR